MKDERNRQVVNAYKRDLDQARASGFVQGIEIKKSPHCRCDAADKMAGCYKLEAAPDVPSRDCTDDLGCNCWWAVIFDDETPATPWRINTET